MTSGPEFDSSLKYLLSFSLSLGITEDVVHCMSLNNITCGDVMFLTLTINTGKLQYEMIKFAVIKAGTHQYSQSHNSSHLLL